MSLRFFLKCSILRGPVAGITILTAGSLATAQTNPAPIKPSNTCRPLNLVANEGGLYRKAFTAITPLEKTGDVVSKTTCAALLAKVKNPGADVLTNLPSYQAILSEFFSNYCHRDIASG